MDAFQTVLTKNVAPMDAEAIVGNVPSATPVTSPDFVSRSFLRMDVLHSRSQGVVDAPVRPVSVSMIHFAVTPNGMPAVSPCVKSSAAQIVRRRKPAETEHVREEKTVSPVLRTAVPASLSAETVCVRGLKTVLDVPQIVGPARRNAATAPAKSGKTATHVRRTAVHAPPMEIAANRKPPPDAMTLDVFPVFVPQTPFVATRPGTPSVQTQPSQTRAWQVVSVPVAA